MLGKVSLDRVYSFLHEVWRLMIFPSPVSLRRHRRSCSTLSPYLEIRQIQFIPSRLRLEYAMLASHGPARPIHQARTNVISCCALKENCSLWRIESMSFSAPRDRGKLHFSWRSWVSSLVMVCIHTSNKSVPGEMHRVPLAADSWVNMPRSGVAYAAQESWVQNGTIRVNKSS